MKSQLQNIQSKFGYSFSISHNTKTVADENSPVIWHHHPEVQIVYMEEGDGKRHVGSHISHYQDGDVLLIGSMLPHIGYQDRLSIGQSETIIQFTTDFLGNSFFNKAEFLQIGQLLKRAKGGITFHGNTKVKVGAHIQKMDGLDGFSKVMNLLFILHDLALSEEYKLLNGDGFNMVIKQADNSRMSQVYEHIKLNFRNSISLDEISQKVNMTNPAFCRFFKKASGKTFTKFVNDYRLVHACSLLAQESLTITEICYKSGFNNFSHFNKSFKSFTGESPSDYRRHFKKIV